MNDHVPVRQFEPREDLGAADDKILHDFALNKDDWMLLAHADTAEEVEEARHLTLAVDVHETLEKRPKKTVAKHGKVSFGVNKRCILKAL